MATQPEYSDVDAHHEYPLHENVQHKPYIKDNPDNTKRTDTICDISIDLENRGAIKGDDSDGRVNWTAKQILATTSLSGLYVGRLDQTEHSSF